MTAFHVALCVAPRSAAVAVADAGSPARLPMSRRELPEAAGPRDVLEAAWEMISRELTRRGVESDRVTGVALTLSGAIDERGLPLGPEWPQTWQGVDLAEWAAAQFPGTARGAGVVVAGEVPLLETSRDGKSSSSALLVYVDESVAAGWQGRRLPMGPLIPGLLAWSLPPRGGRVVDVVGGPALVARWNEAVSARQVSAMRWSSPGKLTAPRPVTALADLLAQVVRDESTARAVIADAAMALAWATSQLVVVHPQTTSIRLAGPLADLPADLFLDLYRRQLHEWLTLVRGETAKTTAAFSSGSALPVSTIPRSRELLLERALDGLANRPQGGLRLHTSDDE